MKYVLAIALALSAASPSAVLAVDLTGNLWDIEAIDDGGNDYGASSMVFSTQTPDGVNFSLTGYIDWISSGGQLGREIFIGTLFQDNTIQLSGTSLAPIPGLGGPSGIINDNYYAVLEPNGNRMAGAWGGTGPSPGIPGDFTATRVPEPSTVALMLMATALLRRRQRHLT